MPKYKKQQIDTVPGMPSYRMAGDCMGTIWLPAYAAKRFLMQNEKAFEMPFPYECPPCPACRHYRPIIEVRTGHAGRIRLCHGKDMRPDFSCFQSSKPSLSINFDD